MNNLFDKRATKALSGAKLVRSFKVVRTVVAGKLSEDTVTKVHIDYLIVLASFKQSITLVVSRLADSTGIPLAGLLSGLAWVLYFSNLVPLTFCVAPHVGVGHIVFAEYLDKAVRLALNLALDRLLEVRKFCKVYLLTTLRGSLALIFILNKSRSISVLTSRVTGENPYLFVLSTHDNVTVLVMSYGPNSLGQLDSLLAGTVGPEFHSTIVASCYDLTSFEAVDGKNEAIVSLKVHHMRPIHRPKLNSLIV